ncbi:MAG: branched-chain amino acid ABC transporter permease [Halorhabdus sp.]
MAATEFLISVTGLILVYSLFTIGLNIKFGFTGLIDFGHVLYFMIGAYVTTVLTAPTRISLYEGIGGYDLPGLLASTVPMGGLLGWLLGVAGGTLIAVIIATLVGLVTIQLREDYLAIASLGIAVIAHTIVNNVRWLFNGTFGIRTVYAPLQALAPISLGSITANLVVFGGLSLIVAGYPAYRAITQARTLSTSEIGLTTALFAVFLVPAIIGFTITPTAAVVMGILSLVGAAVLLKQLTSVGADPIPVLALLAIEAVVVIYFGSAAIDGGPIRVLLNALWLYSPTATPKGGMTYDRLFLVVTATFLVAGYWLANALAQSPYGRVLVAVREDEEVAKALGKETFLFKIESYAIGSAMAAVAGALYAVRFGYIDPTLFGLLVTFYAYAAILMGGVANVKGSVIGMTVFWTLFTGTRFLADLFPPAVATQLASIRIILIGLIIIVIVYYRPDGLLGQQDRDMEVRDS